MPRSTLCAALIALAVPAAHAADGGGNYHLLGAGALPCSRLTAATPEERTFVETWWAGYVTAMNRATPDNYNLMEGTPPEAANAWLAKYCQENPDRLIATAVHAMAEAAYPTRRKSRQ